MRLIAATAIGSAVGLDRELRPAGLTLLVLVLGGPFEGFVKRMGRQNADR